MKNIIILLFLLVCSPAAFSQVEVSVVAKPQGQNTHFSNVPQFSFTEPIKLFVDVSGVPNLTGKGPIYVWTFMTGIRNDSKNGVFSDSNEISKMTQEGTDLWSFTFPSVKEWMGITYKQAKNSAVAAGRPENETRFGFLVKTDNGSGGLQSADLSIPFVGPVYIKTELEVFPLNPGEKDILTFTYNQDLEDNEAMKAEASVYLYAKATLVGGGTLEPVPADQVSGNAELMLVKSGSQHTISIIPYSFFDVPEGKQIESLDIVMQGSSGPEVNSGDPKKIVIVKIK